jgi:serine/threonine-protein kinase RsbW
MRTVSCTCPRVVLTGTQGDSSYLELYAWMPSELEAIPHLADWAMSLIAESRCIVGHEKAVELALREALTNAVLHGNQLDPQKVVRMECRCQQGTGVSFVVSDDGRGFNMNDLPNPLTVEKLEEQGGRGIHLMKLAMDEVFFRRGGAEVHMWKRPG